MRLLWCFDLNVASMYHYMHHPFHQRNCAFQYATFSNTRCNKTDACKNSFQHQCKWSEREETNFMAENTSLNWIPSSWRWERRESRSIQLLLICIMTMSNIVELVCARRQYCQWHRYATQLVFFEDSWVGLEVDSLASPLWTGFWFLTKLCRKVNFAVESIHLCSKWLGKHNIQVVSLYHEHAEFGRAEFKNCLQHLRKLCHALPRMWLLQECQAMNVFQNPSWFS